MSRMALPSLVGRVPCGIFYHSVEHTCNAPALSENSIFTTSPFCLNKAYFNTLILDFFSTKQLLAAKTPIFGAFSKRMIFNTLTSI